MKLKTIVVYLSCLAAMGCGGGSADAVKAQKVQEEADAKIFEDPAAGGPGSAQAVTTDPGNP